MKFADSTYALINSGIRRSFFFFSLAIIVLSACSQERRLAKIFLVSNDTINILLLKTDYVFKKNLKINADSIPEQIRDSVSLSQSAILGKVKEKTFIDLLFSGLCDELKKGKYRIYTEENMDAFMKLDLGSFIFNIVQMELDEYTIPFTASQVYDTMTFYKNFNLNAVSIDLWTEVSQLNVDQEKNTLLFSSDTLSDNIVGHFRKVFLMNEIKYVYTRNDIVVDDLYNNAYFFGSVNAGYINDYFMNRYIHNYYSGNKTPKYFRFNKQRNLICPAGFNRFIFM